MAIACFCHSNADPEREKKIVQSFAEQRVDGIIVTSSRVGALYLPLLSEMMVPIVLVNDQYPGAFVHSVMIGNQEGTKAVTEHLIGLGHRRIAYIGDQFGYELDRCRPPSRSPHSVQSRPLRAAPPQPGARDPIAHPSRC